MKTALKVGGIVLIAALLIAGAAMLVTRSGQPGAAEAAQPTAPVTVGYIEETVSATGNVTAKSNTSLAFESSGPIAEVAVSEGQHVEEGQLLARLATSSLEWQVARAEASLNSALARLEQARKPPTAEELASAEAALDSALAAYDKVAEGPSAEDMSSAQAALDSARATLEKVTEGASAEDLSSAQAALDSARATLQKVKAGPTAEELSAAQAGLKSAQAAVQQAQSAYDRIKDRADALMLPEALTLQNATIELERAQANYDSIANRPTASEFASAQAQVAQAEAQLAQLRERPTTSELASARAQVAQAEAQLAQLQNRPTTSELASARAQVAQAEAQLAQLQDRPSDVDLAVTEAAVDEARIGLAQAQDQLADALLTAPMSGTVLAVNVSAGEWASPGAPAVVLATTEMILDVYIDEIDVAQLAEGQDAHLSFDALRDEIFEGRVTHIAPASTSVGGAVAYAVEISFDPGDRPVRLGMTADVEIVSDSAEGALLVPNRAIEADRQAGRYYVTRELADGVMQRLEVRIGLRDESRTQILEGVEEGDELVLPELPDQTEGDGMFMGPGGGRGGMFGGGM